MQRYQLDAMVGCASIPMQYPGLAHGEGPARVWQQLRQTHLAEPELQVRPRVALPEELASVSTSGMSVEPPALIQGYLRTGAKVLGAPAWDSDFNTADLPIMMRMQDLPSRYLRLFTRRG
jgi:putative hemolysin